MEIFFYCLFLQSFLVTLMTFFFPEDFEQFSEILTLLSLKTLFLRKCLSLAQIEKCYLNISLN